MDGFAAGEGEGEVPVGVWCDGVDHGVFDAGAELFGLGLHFHHEFRAHYAIGESGVVFHIGGGGELASGLRAGEDEGLKVGAAGVDGGGPSGAAGSDDGDVFHGDKFVCRGLDGGGCSSIEPWWELTAFPNISKRFLIFGRN